MTSIPKIVPRVCAYAREVLRSEARRRLQVEHERAEKARLVRGESARQTLHRRLVRRGADPKSRELTPLSVSCVGIKALLGGQMVPCLTSSRGCLPALLRAAETFLACVVHCVIRRAVKLDVPPPVHVCKPARRPRDQCLLPFQFLRL